MALPLLAPECTPTERQETSFRTMLPNPTRTLKVRLVVPRNRPPRKDSLWRPGWVQVPEPPLVRPLAKFQTLPILRSAFNNFVWGACRLVGLDPDQLSLQAPFPKVCRRQWPAPMAWQLAARRLVFFSRGAVRGPVSLLPQKPSRFYRRFPPALLFEEGPQNLFGLVLFRKGTHVGGLGLQPLTGKAVSAKNIAELPWEWVSSSKSTCQRCKGPRKYRHMQIGDQVPCVTDVRDATQERDPPMTPRRSHGERDPSPASCQGRRPSEISKLQARGFARVLDWIEPVSQMMPPSIKDEI